MKDELKRLFAAIVIAFVLVVGAAYAQTVPVTAEPDDTFKLTATFQNLNVANMNLPGVGASLDIKLTRYEKWRVGAVLDGAYQRDSNRILDRFQILGGPQVSYDVGEGRVSLFGRGLFGVTRFDPIPSNVASFRRGTVSFGGGLDVRVGSGFAIRPAQVDVQYINGRPVRYTRAGFGIVKEW